MCILNEFYDATRAAVQGPAKMRPCGQSNWWGKASRREKAGVRRLIYRESGLRRSRSAGLSGVGDGGDACGSCTFVTVVCRSRRRRHHHAAVADVLHDVVVAAPRAAGPGQGVSCHDDDDLCSSDCFSVSSSTVLPISGQRNNQKSRFIKKPVKEIEPENSCSFSKALVLPYCKTRKQQGNFGPCW